MKQIVKILFFIMLCLCSLLSNAYCEEPVLSFRLVHPDHDKLSHVSPSEAKVDRNRYELFAKEKENYWVDKKIELSIKDFKDTKIQEMVMYPPKMKVERREVTSPLPSDASCDIVLYFSKNGQTKIKNLTENNIRRRLAIILNKQLLMAPLILEKITGETISIVGVSYSEAQSLKSAIKK